MEKFFNLCFSRGSMILFESADRENEMQQMSPGNIITDKLTRQP